MSTTEAPRRVSQSSVSRRKLTRAPGMSFRGDRARMPMDELAEPEALARRYVWCQPAEETLASPETLLRQILKIGTADDYVAACQYWGEDAFKQALISAPAGSLDERSWVFWHRHYGLPERPFPKRSFL